MDTKGLDGLKLGFALGVPTDNYPWHYEDTFVGMFLDFEVWIETDRNRWEPWFWSKKTQALSPDELLQNEEIDITELPTSILNFLILRKLKGETYDTHQCFANEGKT